MNAQFKQAISRSYLAPTADNRGKSEGLRYVESLLSELFAAWAHVR